MAMIGPRRKPGRPPLDRTDPSFQLCLTLPSKFYDAIYRAASRERVSMAEFIRQQLARRRPDHATR